MPVSPRASAPASSGGKYGRTPVAPARPMPVVVSMKTLMPGR
jgi:hypothetical protein